MEKRLRPLTIIPTSLYVERKADRELKEIIEYMSKPGYVLVSRQMGKTNLLLHAKRELQRENDIFTYIDLSNPFNSAKECFENIVDTIIETTELLNDNQISHIYKARENKNNLPPHKVHIAELRIVLNSISGKLVIILDEIDALTRSNYSDLIFSQIRSIYFSRVNYQELDRLTYILSGVVQPNDIIKDAKISPFNIGHKIFLNDFTFTEFLLLIEKANLRVGNNIVERIYYWTNGNPRMSWDLCSEIENLCFIREVLPEDVDDIVKAQFLTSYDKPPIDNIRELVKNDKEIRSALVELIYKKGDSISDRLKSKLYLAGIVNYQEQEVIIKNPIINQSLSIDWINDLEKADKGAFEYAISLFKAGRFTEALNVCQEQLNDSVLNSDQKSYLYYYMGFASFNMHLYEDALKYLELTNFSVEDNRQMFYSTRLFKGKSFYFVEKKDESFIELKSIIDLDKRDDIGISALLAYASYLLDEKLHDESKVIYIKLIDENFYTNPKLDQSAIQETRSIAYYKLAIIYFDEDQIHEAIDRAEESIKLSISNSKPNKLLLLYKLLPSSNNSYILETLVNHIISENLVPVRSSGESLEFSVDDLKATFLHCYKESKERFKALHLYTDAFDKTTTSQLLFNLLYYSIDTYEVEICDSIVTELYTNRKNPNYLNSEAELLKLLKIYNYRISDSDNIDLYSEYVNIFNKVNPEEIDNLDFIIFAQYLSHLLKVKNIKLLKDVITTINRFRSKADKFTLANFLIVSNAELFYYSLTGESSKVFEISNQIINYINKTPVDVIESSVITFENLAAIKAIASKCLETFRKQKVKNLSIELYNRNDTILVRYKSGNQKEGKYKKFLNDIEKGECIVVKKIR